MRAPTQQDTRDAPSNHADNSSCMQVGEIDTDRRAMKEHMRQLDTPIHKVSKHKLRRD